MCLVRKADVFFLARKILSRYLQFRGKFKSSSYQIENLKLLIPLGGKLKMVENIFYPQKFNPVTFFYILHWKKKF